jgi:hypothetical protein
MRANHRIEISVETRAREFDGETLRVRVGGQNDALT